MLPAGGTCPQYLVTDVGDVDGWTGDCTFAVTYLCSETHTGAGADLTILKCIMRHGSIRTYQNPLGLQSHMESKHILLITFVKQMQVSDTQCTFGHTFHNGGQLQ
jgi:hypothetical protein